MKKNKMMRAASALLVAVLLTTSVISGTFAKYVTKGEATDSARVAKWGVTVEITGDKAFGEKYDNAVEAAGTKVVSNHNDNVLAPGTYGTLGTVKVKGQPEVKVKVTSKVDLKLTNWEQDYTFDIDNDGINESIKTKCPVVISVNGTEYKVGDTDINNTDDLEKAVEQAIQNVVVGHGDEVSYSGVVAHQEYDANTNFTNATNEVNVTWTWNFGNAGEPITEADINDTALGNIAAEDINKAPVIELETSILVEQVD